ncbi:glycosyltransferase [Jeotgalibacillus proteolyticus]|uniref:Glycosyl transferase family 1 domain-containing protein n=1 Tax=Jeotgalibacillus proteolyticus TaxID=2082395 RepID=A0A2S5GBB3_9BACL|nr:glycosyltransferase [Jeotgalibacillus proteolyticus]PPA70286.1 hypothetical protein C4B60_11955 [Jeotgalibacillus proteolyticus]
MENKKVVFVLNEYNGHGGAQRVAAILSEEFIKDGHEVSILSINESKDEDSYFTNEIPVTVLHEDNYRAGLPKELSSNLKAFRLNTVMKEVIRRKQLEKRRKDVKKYFEQFGDSDVFVIVVQVWGMQWLEEVLYKKNIHIIGQSHESYAAGRFTKRYKNILKYYRQVSKFLLLTQKDEESFQNEGFQNTGMIYNPTPFRDQVDPEKLFSNKVLVSSGRLVEGKGFDVLIEAISLIKEELGEWKLHIYGDGPERESLENLIKILELEDHVFLKGQTNNIEESLKKSSIFVLTSKAEGLPMSLIEAHSCGLPCISTDCAPGIREIIIDYKTGYITPVDDAHLISRHILRLIQNPDVFNQFSKEAFQSSLKFDRSVIKKQWYELFEEVGGYKNDTINQ